MNELIYQRNWLFATNSDFLISISFDSNVVNLWNFKLWLLLDQKNISLKYQWFTTLGSKDIGIRNSEFVAMSQFLCWLNDSLNYCGVYSEKIHFDFWLVKQYKRYKIKNKNSKRGVETKWRRLGDVARGTETVSRGLEVIMQIWRLGGHFCGAHGTPSHVHP